MRRLLLLQVLGLLLLCSEGAAWASTMGGKKIVCVYSNARRSSRDRRGICQVHYGVIGHTGQGYRRVIWPDGVVTLITIPGGKGSKQPVAATIDHYPASAKLSCEQEIYTIFGNTIALKGDLCR